MWESPQQFPELRAGDVHVWKIPLNQTPAVICALSRALASDERERAARFHFEKGRQQYIVSRGALRELLGGYLGESAAAIRFDYSPRGKPGLDTAHASDIAFNLTHSGALALAAFARGARVGVDIERMRDEFDSQRIADRFFTPEESAALRGADESERLLRFAEQWTRKESFIKARGEGLSFPLDAFSILLEGEELALRIAQSPVEAGRWTVRDLEIDEGYAAALCVEARGSGMRGFVWEGIET
ncbi:MAG: 4'-phosphopantetheinyl transferase superfamily protein [Candidatus Hydrogenedentes bacterium]|nr:4'-phosphopantetheinyl transferase superfamily protein [Candidatus Hydrogenedentota bacterium]